MNWNDPTHPLARTEPRAGERAVLAAPLHTPSGPLLCYCLHMEVDPCALLACHMLFSCCVQAVYTHTHITPSHGPSLPQHGPSRATDSTWRLIPDALFAARMQFAYLEAPLNSEASPASHSVSISGSTHTLHIQSKVHGCVHLLDCSKP